MLAAAVCVGNRETYERYAAPGLSRALGSGAEIMEIETDSIFSGYNRALDSFAEVGDLEALILPHQDVVINDPAFAEKVRNLLADESVAVIGAVGATDVRGICWWTGGMHGQVKETRGLIGPRRERASVDSVDGLLLVLSPWAVRNLRFDAGHFHGFHGYDVDFCLQVLAAGKRVVVEDLDVFHHAGLSLLVERSDEDREAFWRSDSLLRAKWQALGRPMFTDEVAAHLRAESEQRVPEDRRSASEQLIELARTQWAVGAAWDAIKASQLAAAADPFATLPSAALESFQHSAQAAITSRPFAGRGFITLAEGARLIHEPPLLAQYGAQFNGDDDASLLIVLAPSELNALTDAVAKAGLAGADAADLSALISDRPFVTAAIDLTPHVHALLEAEAVRGLSEYRVSAERHGLPYLQALAQLRAGARHSSPQ